MEKKINGVGASNGVAIAKAFCLKEEQIIISDQKSKDPKKEEKIFKNAQNKTKEDLSKLQKITLEKLGEEKAQIFEAHIEILNDPELVDGILDLIRNYQYNAPKAINKVCNNFIDQFKAMDNDYFRERSADIKDISQRLLKHALGIKVIDLASIDQEVIIITDDLTPSQTAQLNPNYVKGFLCDLGGRTSHAAIMARTLEIPAITGLKNITTTIKDNDMIAMDGEQGLVVINPENIKIWKEKVDKFNQEQDFLKQFSKKKTITKDGNTKIILEANIGSPDDVYSVNQNGAEGIGLFRTEFLYMHNDHFPTEEEQFESYKQVIERLSPRITIIRTLDIGGDKKLKYFEFPYEMNPFLGYRAIRFTLDRKDIFKTQLRALLRASAYGPLGIMFPMIATIDEFIQAKEFTLECKKELEKEGINVGKNLQIGLMIEIPAAALIADKLGKYTDFMSIGTNDLIQYSMAADRMGENVSYLYQPYNPAILKLIKMTIDGAHKHKKWVGMCGEMAGEPMAVPILLGLGLDAFSMSATSIPKVRSLLANLTINQAQKIAKKALMCETSDEVEEMVKKELN